MLLMTDCLNEFRNRDFTFRLLLSVADLAPWRPSEKIQGLLISKIVRTADSTIRHLDDDWKLETRKKN